MAYGSKIELQCNGLMELRKVLLVGYVSGILEYKLGPWKSLTLGDNHNS